MSTSQRIPLSVLTRNPHKGLARETSYEAGRRRGKVRSQNSEKRGVSDGQGKATIRERPLLMENFGLVDPEDGSASERG